MTDPSTPELSDEAAEVVSAYLDGEASAAEMERVESDPHLLAAVDRLGRTTQLLRAGLILDDLVLDDPITDDPASHDTATDDTAGDVVDRHVAAALEAFDPTAGGARVVDLGAERRRRWYDRVPLGAVAAAAVVIALVGAASQIDTDEGDDTATADMAAEDADAGDAGAGEDAAIFEADEGAGGSASPGLESGTPAAGAGSVRPDFADTDSLANHVREVVAATRSAASTDDSIAADGQAEQFGDDGAASSTCDAVDAAALGDAPVLLVLPASVAGREVTAVVADEGTGRRLVVIDDLTCEVVDDRSV